MKLAIGSDNLGVDLKNMIIEEFTQKGYEFEDFGVYTKDPMDYPDIGELVAKKVGSGEFKRGILICGTGIGMQICANKVENVYAAVCHDIYSTERSILSNNCNLMCMGALVIGPATASALVDRWLSLEFDEKGRSAGKVAKMRAIGRN